MTCQILIGDCRERLKELPDNSVDSVVCDPPYHLVSQDKRDHRRASPSEKQRQKIAATKGFMGQTWDGGDVAFQPETWAEVWRVLKPGGHLVAFSGTRTYHRMTVAIEDAGFEIRDMIAWHYGSGFPKSHDISKAIDRAAGAEREVVGINEAAVARQNKRPTNATQCTKSAPETVGIITAPATDAAREWEGWGTALKPATEPICLARKPLSERSIAANVLRWGTGGLNIDGARIPHQTVNGGNLADNTHLRKSIRGGAGFRPGEGTGEATREEVPSQFGRWPANLCHDGSDEVVAGFPAEAGGAKDVREERGARPGGFANIGADKGSPVPCGPTYVDSGSAARFFYCAKATTEERGEGNNHPTVKPVSLMRWLIRLVTPKGGTVLDPFMGSGSTGLAAQDEQFSFIGCEMSPEYAAIAERRMRDRAGLFADIKVAA
jgi:site-specific DNA-methyltransferase (adenine-specific)